MKDNRRDDNALRHFKRVAKELLVLFRQAVDTQTVSLHWVNRIRKQFVLESAESTAAQTSFPDRVPMADSYLRGFEMLTRPAVLQVGKDVSATALTHYPAGCPVTTVTVIPLEFNGETVALAVLEGTQPDVLSGRSGAVKAFTAAMSHLIQTFLELSELATDEDQWADYEERLRRWPSRQDESGVLDHLIGQIAEMVPGGTISLMARILDKWCVVMTHEAGESAPPLGMFLDDHSLASQALQSGIAEFATHLSGSPRRIGRAEPMVKGASLAIPILLHDRRQALVLVSVENLRFFKESVRHKIVNVVRLAALRLTSGTTRHLAGHDFLSHDTGGLLTEFMDRTLQRQMVRGTAHFGLVTIREVSELRASMRMEELKEVQRKLSLAANPMSHGYAGLCGPHADFVTAVLLSGPASDVEPYRKAIRETIARIPGPLLTVVDAFQDVGGKASDAYDVRRALRLQLDATLKSKKE